MAVEVDDHEKPSLRVFGHFVKMHMYEGFHNFFPSARWFQNLNGPSVQGGVKDESVGNLPVGVVFRQDKEVGFVLIQAHFRYPRESGRQQGRLLWRGR